MSSIICTVDVVLLTLKDSALHVALLRREQEPYAGVLAIPGAFIRTEEDRDAEDAASRTLASKMGVTSPYLEQLATFSGQGRDPRGWSVSVVYYALVPVSVLEQSQAKGIELVPVDKVKGLPFDHRQMVEAAVERVRSKSTYSSLPVHLAEESFTLPKLQSIYEAVMGEPINNVSFRRKLLDELDMVEPIEGAFDTGRPYRPAQLYRLKAAYRQKLKLTDRAFNAG